MRNFVKTLEFCRAKSLEAAPGFEPGMKDLQSSALPLGYAAVLLKMERKTGFEPATPTLARLCSTPELLPRISVIKVVAGPRVELGTRGFSVRCSTN